VKHAEIRSYKTGVLVPVFSLRTPDSAGTGEFLDIIPLVDWGVPLGLDIIQILPVNDTGDDSSPYSALSAFALHPSYCRVQAIPEYAKLDTPVKNEVEHLLETLRKHGDRVRYAEVRSGKIEALSQIYNASTHAIQSDKHFDEWQKENPWVRDYSAFMTLKERHNKAGWQQWRAEFRVGNKKTIDLVWENKIDGQRALFWSWVQFRTSEQFKKASKYCSSMNVMLKGDIPIMMNEDSVDVWSQPRNFMLDFRAGAPPDAYSTTGQNWGFPIYDWDYLATHDYSWWRERLHQADKYYHAYRIDHVLGFFRIWTIPREHSSGLLGYYKPSIYISHTELEGLGFDKGRIRWLAEPHVPTQRIRELFGERASEIMSRCFERVGNEELFVFKPEIRGERDIQAYSFLPEETEKLLVLFRDRVIISIEENLYTTGWYFRDSWRYQTLSSEERARFEGLVERHRLEAEALWQKLGEKLLSFMISSVSMLTCAEDLGAVPDCVPVTLEKLGILGLRIPRWARYWKSPGSPFVPPEDYPVLSVCAASVHDTSTVREWWEREPDREGWWKAMGGKGPSPAEYEPHVARAVITSFLKAASQICVLQIQDFLALTEKYRSPDPSAERMNIPGTIGPHNWSWRMPVDLGTLREDEELNPVISELVAERKKRPLLKAR